MSCLLLAGDAHGFFCDPGLSRPRAVCVGVCVLQCEEGVGGDGALALQVGEGQLRAGQRHGGHLARGGEGLQLLQVLMLLLDQLQEQRLLLLVLSQRAEG